MMRQNNGPVIVIVTECPYSGVLRAMLEHSKLLSLLGFKIFFVVPKTPRDRYGEQLEKNQKELGKFGEVLNTPLRRNYRFIRQDKILLAKLLSKFSDCIVMSYSGYAGKISRLLFKENKISLLYHVPQCIDIVRRPFWQRPIEFFWENYLANWASFYIACSKNEETVLKKIFKIKKEKIITIPNFLIPQNEVKNNLEKNHYIILGRVTKDKRVETILKVAKKLKILEQFVIIGDGGQLKSLSNKYPQAVFTGHLYNSAVFKILSQAKYIVSNSIIEGLPFAIIEAMSAGVIPIVSDIPAHHNLISGKQDGFFFKNELELKKILQTTLKQKPEVFKKYVSGAIKRITNINNSSKLIFINHFKKYGKRNKKNLLGGVRNLPKKR